MSAEQQPTNHFMNEASEIVKDSLVGLTLSNPNVNLLTSSNVIIRSDIDSITDSKVTLLSGGGSGHEPSHSSLVGRGMLSSAVNGYVFASPSVYQIHEGLKASLSTKGTVIVVKKYTGDMLNFGLAMELLKAKNPEAKVGMVVVDDDVGINDDGSLVGRRGLAGTVLVHKLAGGLAELNYDLETILSEANQVVSNLGTVGISLDRCQVPADHHKKSDTTTTTNQVEFGLGIHNEPGYQTLNWDKCDNLVAKILDKMSNAQVKDKQFKLAKEAGQVILINNLGGTSKLEEGVITKSVIEQLEKKGIVPELVIVGTFMTSLNMHGFSITSLTLPNDKKQLWLQALLLKTEVSAWNGANTITKIQLEKALKEKNSTVKDVQELTEDDKAFELVLQDGKSDYIRYLIGSGCKTLLQQIDNITKYDEISGDGDCGLTMQSAAKGVLEMLKPTDTKPASTNPTLSTQQVSTLLLGIVRVLDTAMGGSSGALFRIFVLGLVKGLTKVQDTITLASWQIILQTGIDTLYQHTPARIGDRTLVDGIAPFINYLSDIKSTEELKLVLDKTESQVHSTSKLVPKLGRSAYQNPQKLIDANVPDPGAFAVFLIIKGIAESL